MIQVIAKRSANSMPFTWIITAYLLSPMSCAPPAVTASTFVRKIYFPFNHSVIACGWLVTIATSVTMPKPFVKWPATRVSVALPMPRSHSLPCKTIWQSFITARMLSPRISRFNVAPPVPLSGWMNSNMRTKVTKPK